MYFNHVAVVATIVTVVIPRGVSTLNVDKFSHERNPKTAIFQSSSDTRGFSGEGDQKIVNPVGESSMKSTKSSKPVDVNIRDIEEVEEQLDLPPETSMGPDDDIQESPRLSSNEEAVAEDDDLDRRLIRIADHLSEEHLSIDNFKPSVGLLNRI